VEKKWVREPAAQPGGVNQPGQRVVRWRVAVDPPTQAMALEAVEQGLGGVVGDERLRRGHVHHIAAGGGGVEEGPVGEGARGHLAEPMVKGGEPAGQGGQDRHLLGGVAGHELGVLLIGGLAGELGEERADVVGEEPVHGGLLVRVLRGVEGRLRLEDPAVGLVQDPEQLGGGTPHPDRARGCSWWARCHRARPCGPRRARPSQGSGCSAPCRATPSKASTSPGWYSRPSRLSNERFSNITTTT
jgi:hypothetical protein